MFSSKIMAIKAIRDMFKTLTLELDKMSGRHYVVQEVPTLLDAKRLVEGIMALGVRDYMTDKQVVMFLTTITSHLELDPDASKISTEVASRIRLFLTTL